MSQDAQERRRVFEARLAELRRERDLELADRADALEESLGAWQRAGDEASRQEHRGVLRRLAHRLKGILDVGDPLVEAAAAIERWALEDAGYEDLPVEDALKELCVVLRAKAAAQLHRSAEGERA